MGMGFGRLAHVAESGNQDLLDGGVTSGDPLS